MRHHRNPPYQLLLGHYWLGPSDDATQFCNLDLTL
jgi:hypothetical protein